MMLKPAEYASTPYNVGTFQSNYSVEMKWDSEYEEEMVRNAAEKTKMLVERGKLDLMIWPECLLMREIEDPDMLSHVEAASKALGAPLFTGSERYEKKSGRSMNSSWLVDGQGKPVDYYDKVHLAPFGEFVPLSEMFPFIGKVVPAIGDVGSGTEQKVFTAGSRKLGPMICFEVLFTSVAETLRKQGADFLVVITNLAWFGHSAILPQELDIARIRAIETRLPLVHCANTGISGMFDPYGRFSLARIGFDGAGRMGEYSANIPPEALIMRRCMGAFTLPLPAPHLTPGGSWWFPRVAGLATLAMAALSLVIRRKQTPEGGDDAPRKA
jgi:apolipoprotein N-acyltransferase